MTLPVTSRRAARAEFTEAAAWYEARRHGLGAEFIAQIERGEAVAKYWMRRVLHLFSEPAAVSSHEGSAAHLMSGDPRRQVIEHDVEESLSSNRYR